MKLEERVLILAPIGEDAAKAAQVLTGANISNETCLSLDEVRRKFLEGAGALLITEESLTSTETTAFIAVLRQQEMWSDIPIIIITSGGEATSLSHDIFGVFDTVGNMTLLERPLKAITLISAAQVALRARRRQYHMKRLLETSLLAEEKIRYYAEEILKKNNDLQHFAAIVKSSEDAIISKDLKGIIMSWNEAAERIFGYKAEEVVGRSINILIPRDRFNEEPVFLERIKQGQKIEHYDTVRQRKDGSFVDIGLTISPMRDAEGNIIGASKIARDITQRKKDEHELKMLTTHLEQRVRERTEQLEEQAARLRDLAVELTEVEQRERRRLAEVLHDHLQQYLVATKMRLELLERKAVNIDKIGFKDARSYLDEAIDASRRLTAELRPPALYEGGLRAGLEYLSEKMKDQHKLRVHLSLSGNIEPGTDAMKIMIYQCVQELLFNTVKYARVSECFLRLIRLENHALKITIEDEGVGFDAAQVVHKDGGGFGLFSIRERMRALGGELQISSVPGQGSIFTIIVPDSGREPVLESVGLHEEKTIEPRSEENGIVVLVADDHPIIRQSLASLLIAQPFIKEVIQAANGQEAVRKAEARDPDIILMDINMPVMNGIEATQLLGRKNLHSKVIGLSVQSENEMAHAMKDLGAVAYFNKGDDTSMLINSIKKFAYIDQ